MKTIPLANIKSFNKLFVHYLNENPSTKQFYNLYPNIENFKTQIQNKKYSQAQRQLLHKTFVNQYIGLELSSIQRQNIDNLLLENTFTVTTGHQLNIATGPLYVILKLVTTINLAKELAEKYPEYNFVPMYWMATEDHDFEEINHFYWGDEKKVWEQETSGAVGDILCENIPVNELFGFEMPAFVKEIYASSTTLADATRKLIQTLFHETGLLCLDANEIELKTAFSSFFEQELIQKQSETLIQNTIQQFEKEGYKAQIHPREINLFYLDKNTRERIVFSKNEYLVNNTSLKFSEAEIIDLVKTSPEKFSPNVAFRPLYQEFTLPNLATVGGPAEIAYWLELKSTFDFYKVEYPILVPRTSALVINKNLTPKIDKLQISSEDLFLEEKELKNKVLEKLGAFPNLEKELQMWAAIANNLKEIAPQVDVTLEASAGAESAKGEKLLLDFEKRLQKAYEKKNEIVMRQLDVILAKLFPENGFQERKHNYFYLATQYENLLPTLLNEIKPLNFEFLILE